MSDARLIADYEKISLAELDVAGASTDIDKRCAHLNTAHVDAVLGERRQDRNDGTSEDQQSNQLWRRAGTLDNAKRVALINALENSRYNMTAAAARLGIGRSTIYRLMNEYCVQAPIETDTFSKAMDGVGSVAVGDQSLNIRSRLELKDGKLILVGLTLRN